MKYKFLALFGILLLISLLAEFQFVPTVKANPTVEEVYTNSFDSTYVAWFEIGSTPYLQDIR